LWKAAQQRRRKQGHHLEESLEATPRFVLTISLAAMADAHNLDSCLCSGNKQNTVITHAKPELSARRLQLDDVAG